MRSFGVGERDVDIGEVGERGVDKGDIDEGGGWMFFERDVDEGSADEGVWMSLRGFGC